MARRSGNISDRILVAKSAGYPYLAAILTVGIGVGAAFLLQRLPLANLSLVFLTVVVIVAARWGFGPSMAASLLSFLSFNFFFTEPYFTLRINNRDDVATLAFFLLMAALAGNLAARMRREMTNRRAALERISTLYDFSRRVSAAVGAREVMQWLCEHLHALLHRPTATFLPDVNGLIQAAAAGIFRADAVDMDTAWRNTDRIQAIGGYRYVKLIAARGVVGLVAIEIDPSDADHDAMIIALCDQAMVAVERTMLAGDLDRERLKYETEQLRAALLTSVSHDLRTPLASIIGSTSSVIEYGEAFSAEDSRQLLQAVLDEAIRLDRYVQNLLDMTRLGHAGFTLSRDWVDLNDISAAAVRRLGIKPSDAAVVVDIAEDARLLQAHGVFLEQTLFNLLENAVRHSPLGGRILVKGYRAGERVNIDVIDQGPGIPPADRVRVFDLFYSAARGDRGGAGTGLGLAICRGMIGAHGGNIDAHAGPDGVGTRMHIALPCTVPEYDESLVS